MNAEPVIVATVQGEFEEQALRTFLSAHGIPTVVRGEALRMMGTGDPALRAPEPPPLSAALDTAAWPGPAPCAPARAALPAECTARTGCFPRRLVAAALMPLLVSSSCSPPASRAAAPSAATPSACIRSPPRKRK